nr:hypothetical protein [uncultured Kingella sp.]
MGVGCLGVPCAERQPENVNCTRVGINAHPTGRADYGFLPAGADGFAASGKTVGQPEKPENRLPA